MWGGGGLSFVPCRPLYTLGMFYRLFRWLNDVYPVTVFFLYIAFFFVAFMLAFFIPAGAFLILIGSIFALLPFAFANTLIKRMQRVLARSALSRGVCPACNTPLEERQCKACLIEFEPNGGVVISE